MQLNGFTYSEIDIDAQEPKKHQTWTDAVRGAGFLSYLIWGNRHLPRLTWLHRQFPNGNDCAFLPQPFTQLSNVLRQIGHYDAAIDVIRERRRLQTARHSSKSERGLLTLFGLLFGFGYSISRALITLLALILLNASMVLLQASYFHTLRSVETAGSMPTEKPCEQIVEHTLNQVLPIVHLERGGGCDLAPTAGLLSRGSNMIVLLLSWVLVPTAALTLSGVLRESSSKD